MMQHKFSHYRQPSWWKTIYRCMVLSVLQSLVHPFAKLCWFKRRTPSEIRKIRAETIYMRLRVAPAFFVHADGIVDNDGYLFSH